MKLTKWFPGHIKPVRKDVYQQMAGPDLGYQYWDGKVWRGWLNTPEKAMLSRWAVPHEFQNDDWRGVAK
jgi:hypothetical protein